MRIKFLQKIIDKIRRKNKFEPKNYDISTVYGKIYHPIYNLTAPIYGKNPDVYDKDDNKLEYFFLRDIHYANFTRAYSKYFLWDKFNFNLDIHFYSGKSMLETMGNPLKRYGFFPEPYSIAPYDYNIFKTNKGIEKDFDLIFTFSEEILDKIPNSKFVPFCANIWCADEVQDNLYLSKNKNISILSSNKEMCELHKYRIELADRCKRLNLADTFGTFDGGQFVKVSDTLKNYRYSICIENYIEPYFFTEKIVSAFAFQTIPIYLGATKIDKFFNPNGIIKLDLNDDIEKVLKQCTEEEYNRRLPAIMENYKIALKYGHSEQWNFIYENYLTCKDISDKSSLNDLFYID